MVAAAAVPHPRDAVTSAVITMEQAIMYAAFTTFLQLRGVAVLAPVPRNNSTTPERWIRHAFLSDPMLGLDTISHRDIEHAVFMYLFLDRGNAAVVRYCATSSVRPARK